MWYICAHTLSGVLVIKRWNLAILTTGMELESIMLGKIREWQKLYDFTCIWNLKMKTNKHNKTETDSQI